MLEGFEVQKGYGCLGNRVRVASVNKITITCVLLLFSPT